MVIDFQLNGGNNCNNNLIGVNFEIIRLFLTFGNGFPKIYTPEMKFESFPLPTNNKIYNKIRI